MLTVKIGEVERHQDRVDEVEEGWIGRELARLRSTKRAVCVIVRIDTSAVRFELATPSCPPGGGGSRQLTDEEHRVFEMWKEQRLNADGFGPGNLIAFFKHLGRIL